MNKKLLDMVATSGFVMWSDEPWQPAEAIVDWASNYDTELKLFAEKIIAECRYVVADAVLHQIPASEYPNLITEHFEDKCK